MSGRLIRTSLSSAAALIALACEASADDPAPAAPPSAQTQEPGISPVRYVAAGMVGTFVGYGLGHAIAYEWSSFGWLCTAGELTPLLVGVATGSFEHLSNNDSSDDVVPIALVVSAGVVHVIEIVDIWSRPRVRSDWAQSAPQAGFAALPLPSRHGASVVFVGSF